MLLPREHGAYAQLLFPLVTGLAVTGGAAPAWSVALAATAAFLAHEPFVVLRGARGPRVRRDHHRSAPWLFGAATLVALAAGIGAVVLTPAPDRWAFAVPAVPAMVFAVAVVRDEEKSLVGELAAALTLATTILPMCVASGLPPSIGAALALPYSVLFTLTTGLVRAVVVGTRGGGDAADVLRTRVVTFAMALLLVGATVSGARSGRWSWVVLVMELPALAAGSLLAVAPPTTAALRRVGWTIVVVSTLTAALLVTAGRSGALRPRAAPARLPFSAGAVTRSP